MGFEQVSVGWVLNGGALNMDRMPYSGISMTYAANRLITDSCAGGTGLSIREKTNYGYMACDTEGKPVETNLEIAKRLGKKTGVVVTCRLNDATPVDFCGHALDRHEEMAIATQYVDCGVDFISGGGSHFWTEREDGRNLVEEMKAKGYTFVDRLEDVAGAEGDKFLGLFGPYDLPAALDRGPVLEETAMKAIEMLDNPKGFFLMIEGSRIDDYGHGKKVGYMAEELFDFDRTLGKVLEWAAKDGHTLVVVTADHATGGLTMLKGSLPERNVKVNFSTSGHNGIFVPVFAYGPHAEEFTGLMENYEVSRKVAKYIK